MGEELLADSSLDDVRRIVLLSQVALSYAAQGQQDQALAALDRMQSLPLNDASNVGFVWGQIDLVRANLKATGFPLPPRPASAPAPMCCCDN